MQDDMCIIYSEEIHRDHILILTDNTTGNKQKQNEKLSD